MIVDSSALVAIVKKETKTNLFLDALSASTDVSISAGTWLEAAIVCDNGPDIADRQAFDHLIWQFSIGIIPVDAAQAELARGAYRRFGKGRHEAGLNFGDCFAYALAKSTGRPLLFKGNDFSKTDIYPALRD